MNPNHLLNSIDVAADWVGLRYVKEDTTFRLVRDGNPEANTRESKQGIMVEVLVDGQFAYYGTSRLDESGIAEAARKAYQLAKAAAAYNIHPFSDNVRPVAKGSYRSSFEAATSALSPGVLSELLVKASNELKVSDKIVTTNALARIVETESKFASSNGSDVDQQYVMVSADYTAVAQDGTVTQKRSDGGMMAKSFQAGLEVFDEADVLRRCRIIGEEAVELLTAEECPTETMDLVLAPDQMMLQIHESVGHALELDRILGDERNYAGWSFVRPGDFGSLQYGSKLMNITFDPTVRNEFASYAFDDGGLKAEKEFLIKEGLLLRGLGGMESQVRSGLKGVANFRSSSWNRAPIDRMANLNLEPGNSSRDEIISSVERGVFMTSNRSWSIDDYRNKFQFGCEYGKLIENGKLTKTVKNPNYRAISNPFWNSLKMIGDPSTFEVYGTPYCGKGEPNQAIRVGHASPLCLFGDIEIFGGA
ncbi:MAG: TldD/PmbA family protein [Candidatus Marinimicrobia bacterium]|nr:TldD/PmbA family protein [Candidatus Neomarinimicrobiota bacterium]MCF7851363.1 TldD/PmbA family protein [Candidatus Neomarinimicrobiota bacterium]MCF7904197.1 TldD/PmbA family protein [Candidatus Neomarinimicrobiota bacterium]